MNSKSEMIFLVATNPRDHQQAMALKSGFDQLEMQTILITPSAYVKEEMVGLAQEIASLDQKAHVIIFQTTLLTIIREQGDYFPFYDQSYQVLSIWEQEPLPYLFYLKDYVGKNHQLLNMNAINHDFYTSLGFGNWKIIPSFLWFPVAKLPEPTLTSGLCYIGSIMDPNSYYNPVMFHAKTIQLKPIWDTAIEEVTAQNYKPDCFTTVVQRMLTTQSDFNPVSLFSAQFLLGITRVLTTFKYLNVISEFKIPLLLSGECDQLSLIKSESVIVKTKTDNTYVKWSPAPVFGSNPQDILADLAAFPWFIAEHSLFWDVHYPEWSDAQFVYKDQTDFSNRFVPLTSFIHKNQDVYEKLNANLTARFSPIHTARAIQEVVQ